MNRKLLAGLSIFTISAVLAWLYLRHRPTVVPFTGPQFDRLGQFAGDEISQLLGSHGTVVIVQWDATFAGISRYDAQIAQLKKQLASHGIKVVAIETIKVKRQDKTLPVRFSKLVSQYSAADAIILVGPAYGLTVADLAALPSPHPQLVSVLSLQTGLKTLFDQQLITLAITDALLAENIKSADRDFLVLTVKNASELPNRSDLTGTP